MEEIDYDFSSVDFDDLSPDYIGNKIIKSISDEEVLTGIGFSSMANRADVETVHRELLARTLIPLSNVFLKTTMNGILANDLILLGAETGAGKTQMAKDMAIDAAKAGFRVAMFCLEADFCEMETREKYSLAVEIARRSGEDIRGYDYLDWITGSLPELNRHAIDANKIIQQSYRKNIYTFYKQGRFTIANFIEQLKKLEGKVDLIICDHLHYFDFTSSDHNKEIHEIVHTIRSLVQDLNLPVVLIAHLRKLLSGENKKLVPEISDFHGSSEIGKVCTRAIMLGKGEFDPIWGNYKTYIKLTKSRYSGSRANIAGELCFDPTIDRYTNAVRFGTIENNKFIPFEDNKKIPGWLAKKLANNT